MFSSCLSRPFSLALPLSAASLLVACLLSMQHLLCLISVFVRCFLSLSCSLFCILSFMLNFVVSLFIPILLSTGGVVVRGAIWLCAFRDRLLVVLSESERSTPWAQAQLAIQWSIGVRHVIVSDSMFCVLCAHRCFEHVSVNDVLQVGWRRWLLMQVYIHVYMVHRLAIKFNRNECSM